MRTRSRKLLVGVLAVLALTVSSFSMVGNMSTAKAAEDEGLQMHRLYNPYSGEHFYTASDVERNACVSVGWQYEGVAFIAPTDGDPVYRLYSPYSGDHHYTLDAGERDWLVRDIGWNYEGVAWCSKSTGDKCEKAMYRLYNPNAWTGAHHYTTNEGEKDWLISCGWIYEGTSWVSMHEVFTQGTIEATCSHEGYTGGTTCATCGKKFSGSVIPKNDKHLHTTYVPAVTETIRRGSEVTGECTYVTCNLCGEEVYRDGDNGQYGNVDGHAINHLNAKHGYHLATVEDWLAGLVTDEESNAASEEAMSVMTWHHCPLYYEEVVISPAHTHCNDCGKDY
jgi:hypothetical protein